MKFSTAVEAKMRTEFEVLFHRDFGMSLGVLDAPKGVKIKGLDALVLVNVVVETGTSEAGDRVKIDGAVVQLMVFVGAVSQQSGIVQPFKLAFLMNGDFAFMGEDGGIARLDKAYPFAFDNVGGIIEFGTQRVEVQSYAGVGGNQLIGFDTRHVYQLASRCVVNIHILVRVIPLEAQYGLVNRVPIEG